MLKEMSTAEVNSNNGEDLTDKIYKDFYDKMLSFGFSINYLELEEIEVLK
jgi:Rod binding domain-containing protein